MLLRFVVAMLCLMWSAAEFQCPGPGRFSTSPGFCTNEYYTCNREANREFIAYVLNCPGHTLFNERTRRCSNAKTISCTVATNTNQTGPKSTPVKATASRRQMLRTRTSPGLFTDIINAFSAATLNRKRLEYRKPGRPLRVTPNLYPPAALETKPQTRPNQWRIRQSTTKKSTVAWTKTLASLKEMKHDFKSTTAAGSLETINSLSQKLSVTIPYRAADSPTPKTFATGEFNDTPAMPTINANTSLSTSVYTFLKAIPTKSIYLSQHLYPTNTDSRFAELDRKDIKQTGVTHATKLSENLTNTAQSVKLHSQNTPSSQLERYCASISPEHSTKPMQSTTPMTSELRNELFETTPEPTIKKYDQPIQFFDLLETTENSDVLKIVYVSGNLESIPGNMTTKRKKQTQDNQITENKIRYFYDSGIDEIRKTNDFGTKGNRPKLDNLISPDNTSIWNKPSRKRQPKQSAYYANSKL